MTSSSPPPAGSALPSPALVQELQALLSVEFGVDLPLEEVAKIGAAWLSFFTLLTQPDLTEPKQPQAK